MYSKPRPVCICLPSEELACKRRWCPNRLEVLSFFHSFQLSRFLSFPFSPFKSLRLSPSRLLKCIVFFSLRYSKNGLFIDFFFHAGGLREDSGTSPHLTILVGFSLFSLLDLTEPTTLAQRIGPLCSPSLRLAGGALWCDFYFGATSPY